uniref:UBC core domain-containing protein n=1 Tax=Cynoglossus semilaevis TaxID=244447 RepID=A0A3P8WXK7_CYNSE
MAEPNPDDPLMADISSEFKYNKSLFMEKARRWTQCHAVQKNTREEQDGQGVTWTERTWETKIGKLYKLLPLHNNNNNTMVILIEFLQVAPAMTFVTFIL